MAGEAIQQGRQWVVVQGGSLAVHAGDVADDPAAAALERLQRAGRDGEAAVLDGPPCDTQTGRQAGRVHQVLYSGD